MKSIFLLLGVAALASLSDTASFRNAVREDVDWRVLREETHALRSRLEEVGVLHIAEDALTPQRAPLIHSKCWVDWLPEGDIDRRACEEEIRGLGLDIVRQLERQVLTPEDRQDVVALEDKANGLLDLAEWLSTSHGYGNYRIKRWIESIAANVTARLAIQERYAPERARALLARIADSHRNIVFRVDALNGESPHAFTLPPPTLSDGNACLRRQWGTYLRATNVHYQNLAAKGLFRGVMYRFASVRDDIPEHAFYWDDDVGDATLGESWDKKRHYGLCVGDIDRDCRRDVEKIIEFREVVGLLPVPNALERLGGAAGRQYCERLDWMWYDATGNRNNSGVGDIVLKIVSGRPLDLESQRLVNNSCR